MLKIYGRATSYNVQKVMWLVAELGLPHQRIDVGGKFGGLDTPEFLAMNPNGKIPVIDDGGVIVWESNAIVRYLAAKYSLGQWCPASLMAMIFWPRHSHTRPPTKAASGPSANEVADDARFFRDAGGIHTTQTTASCFSSYRTVEHEEFDPKHPIHSFESGRLNEV